jgi:HSP20 family protein
VLRFEVPDLHGVYDIVTRGSVPRRADELRFPPAVPSSLAGIRPKLVPFRAAYKEGSQKGDLPMALIDAWRPRRHMLSRLSSGSHPFAEQLTRMQREMEDLAERFFGEMVPGAGMTAFSPPIDIVDRGNEIVVRADLPGMEQKDIQIELQDNVLTIRGERKDERQQESDNYRWSERWDGSFMRSITLPTGIDATKIQAQFKNGVLDVRMPKKQEASPKKIEVKG